ncbi:hypothetical protein OIU76_013898 [Salix suchowensis]|nr:hypothetical protein OIU76_013898 [Salix suchowensis]
MATKESLTGLVNRTQRACTVLGKVKACLSGKLSRPLMLLVARVLGKSSVSESVVGRDFLPRGSEVVALNMSSSRGSLLIQSLLLWVLHKFPDPYICRETVFRDSSLHH